MRRYRVVIADDEPLLRDAMRAALEGEADLDIVAVCADGDEALEAILNERPDLALLDVQMPGLTGLQVVDALPAEERPVIVFVTAYDAYAVRAFEVNAVDYLLKPYDPGRLRAALHRARQWLTSEAGTAGGLDAAIRELQPRSAWAERVLPVSAGRIHVMPVGDIELLEAHDNYVRVQAAGRTGLLRETLTSLHGRLDPAVFVRVHRSAVVNLLHVVEMRPRTNGDYTLMLKSGTTATMSRTYSSELLQRLG